MMLKYDLTHLTMIKSDKRPLTIDENKKELVFLKMN